jgi:hypothetical protein
MSTFDPASTMPMSNDAALTFRDVPRKPFEHWDGVGIRSVDRHQFDPPQTHIYIAPGRRSVGWLCAGWVTVDGYPTVEYSFERGKSYEMTCEDTGVVIRPVK